MKKQMILKRMKALQEKKADSSKISC